MDGRETYTEELTKLEARRGFHIHLAVYIVVGVLLITINLSVGSEYLWFRWPLMGWGVGILFHALTVFVFPGRLPSSR